MKECNVPCMGSEEHLNGGRSEGVAESVADNRAFKTKVLPH